jgi:hydroxyacylglutathione hydrolase
LIDVRNPGERELGCIPGSQHIPLAQLRIRLDEVSPDKPIVVHCAGGWRSSVAASLLRANGFEGVSDLAGGYNAWAHASAVSNA